MSTTTQGPTRTMISLQWSHFKSHVLKGLSTSFENVEEFADVTLVCGDEKSLKAHKLILSMWSPYFRKIFLNNICTHPVIVLRDFKSEDVEVILRFIYEGQALLPPENEGRILETAISLQISGFTSMREPLTSTPEKRGGDHHLSGSQASASAQTPYQQHQGLIGISPIPIPTTREAEPTAAARIIIESPPSTTAATSVKTAQVTPKKTTVYKPHKRQKIELTPTKSPTTTPTKIPVPPDDPNQTTMYSLDQQRIIVTEQEIPRDAPASQELEYIEIINISPDQNSVTLNLPPEMDAQLPLEPVVTKFLSSPTASAQTHHYVLTPATMEQVHAAAAHAQGITSAVPGPSTTNHRGGVVSTHEQQQQPSSLIRIRRGESSSVEMIPCPKCGRIVKETSLRVHMSRTHLEEGTILVCPICSKVIHSKGVYYKHMHIHKKKGQQVSAAS